MTFNTPYQNILFKIHELCYRVKIGINVMYYRLGIPSYYAYLILIMKETASPTLELSERKAEYVQVFL